MNEARPSNEANLICEALVKEILRADRWCAKVDAWQALLEVRRVAKDMEAERKHLSGEGSEAASQRLQEPGIEAARFRAMWKPAE